MSGKASVPIRGIRGSITLATLCFAAVLAIALGSYYSLCHSSYDLSTRLTHEDRARELAQSGLEEALWALNQDTWNQGGPAGNQSWTTSGANRTLTVAHSALGQGATGEVVLTVANYAATGPAWPQLTAAATVSVGDGRRFSRTLQATTTPAPLFGNAIASSSSYVSFASGGTVDSWNGDPDNDTATARVAYAFTAGNPDNYAAVVAGVDDGTYGVVLNQARVNGYVATRGKPISYSTSGSPAGMVLGPATAVAVKVDPARVGLSAFVPASAEFTLVPPDASAAGGGGVIGNMVALINSFLGARPARDVYRFPNNLTISGGVLPLSLLSDNITVSGRDTVLIVEGNLTIQNTGQIVVDTDASIQLFVTGDITIGGNGIDNRSGNPRKFALFSTGASTTDSIEYTTTADFHGVIYSEHKPIDIKANATFYGALLSSGYVKFSGAATAPVLHYDTSLRKVRFENVRTPYLIDQLTEP